MIRLLLELILSELKWSDVIILKYVRLKGLQELSLDEHLGNLCLDSHRLQVRDEPLTDVSFSLCFPLAYTKLLCGTHFHQLCEWIIQSQSLENLDKLVDCISLLWCRFECMEVPAHQSKLVVVQGHVGLVEHALFFDSLLPSSD